MGKNVLKMHRGQRARFTERVDSLGIVLAQILFAQLRKENVVV